MKNILLSIVICCLCYACVQEEDETHHYRIKFVNNSEHDVYVESTSTSNPMDPIHLFTMVLHNSPERHRVQSNHVNVDALDIRLYWYDPPYEGWFDDHENKKLRIYVYDAEYFENENYLENYEKSGYVNSDLIQSVDVGLEDLQRLNWTITYPFTTQ